MNHSMAGDTLNPSLNIIAFCIKSESGPYISLKTQGYYVVNFVVADGAEVCRRDNFLGQQWRRKYNYVEIT